MTATVLLNHGRREGSRERKMKEGGKNGREQRRTHLHQPPGLTDDGVLQAVQDEAVYLPQDSHWGLSDLPQQCVGSVHGGWRCLRVRDQLNQRDIIWWIHLGRQKEEED
jgi:hypothetical protein